MILTKEEKAWVKKLNKILSQCPSTRLGFASMGDPSIYIFDITRLNEIIEFCRRMLSGKNAPMGTPFFGTGYISSEGFSETREEHIASINQRRYCKYPFPTEDPDAAHHIKKLFTQEEFFDKITSIANKV